MKRIVLFFCFLLSGIAGNYVEAQRCIPGIKAVRLSGGMVDGFYTKNNENDLAFYAGITIDKYVKGGNRWVYGIEYLHKEYDYKNIQIPAAQFTGEAGYYYNFLSDNKKIIFLSLGGSVMTGYETSNWGKKLLYDGSLLEDKDRFIYGGAITLETEAYLNDWIVLFANVRERILFGSSIGKFHLQYGIGVKFILM